MTDGAFARLLDVDRSTVSKLKRGKLNTTLDLMRRVAAVTGGAVTPNDLAMSGSVCVPTAAAVDSEIAA